MFSSCFSRCLVDAVGRSWWKENLEYHWPIEFTYSLRFNIQKNFEIHISSSKNFNVELKYYPRFADLSKCYLTMRNSEYNKGSNGKGRKSLGWSMFSPAKPSVKEPWKSAHLSVAHDPGQSHRVSATHAGKCSAPGCTKVAKCHLPKAGPVLGRRKSARQLVKLHLPFSFHPSLGRTFVARQ